VPSASSHVSVTQAEKSRALFEPAEHSVWRSRRFAAASPSTIQQTMGDRAASAEDQEKQTC
jgi:hypothetical protein